jgi:hypothetical protein
MAETLMLHEKFVYSWLDATRICHLSAKFAHQTFIIAPFPVQFKAFS